MAIASLYESYRYFLHPFPNWMTSAQRWYDGLLGFVLWGAVIAACVYYANYRRRLIKSGQAAKPRPWHLRNEVRSLVYLFAFVQLLEFPLAIWKTIVALRDPATPAIVNSACSLFPFDGLLAPAIGIFAIYYDRLRTTRERRLLDNLCLMCGYDLRASAERCPECGAIRKQTGSTAAS